ncbi:uncharacterized protein RCO7_07674 [Rhynchosporium graminicola]|uniref:Uncharacterized protein n=1 Tax=Rhynchosporium graminicola TaxID=2792576 RepID=A0A1E1LPU2_9HELO|nr:uncharacterized protein RCO7_07674 [Rhynchosporium commune]
MPVITAPQTAPGAPIACPTQTIVAATLHKLEAYQTRWGHCLIQQSFSPTGENYVPPPPEPTYSSTTSSSSYTYKQGKPDIIVIVIPIAIVFGFPVLFILVEIFIAIVNKIRKSCVRCRAARRASAARRLAASRSRSLPQAPRQSRLKDIKTWLNGKFSRRSPDRNLENALQLTPVERLSNRVRALSKRYSNNPLPLERQQSNLVGPGPIPAPASVHNTQDLQNGNGLATPDHPPAYRNPPAYQSADDLRFVVVAAPLTVPELAYRGDLAQPPQSHAQASAQPESQSHLQSQEESEPPPPQYEHRHNDPLYESESNDDTASETSISPRERAYMAARQGYGNGDGDVDPARGLQSRYERNIQRQLERRIFVAGLSAANEHDWIAVVEDELLDDPWRGASSNGNSSGS